jgi:hypothetical protein
MMCLQQLLHRPPWAILNRLRNMRRLNVLAACQIGDGACQLQHPMISSRAEVHPLHSRLQQALTRPVHLAELPDLGGAHIRVARQRRALKRTCCRSRAASTRAGTALDGSPSRSLLSFS